MLGIAGTTYIEASQAGQSAEGKDRCCAASSGTNHFSGRLHVSGQRAMGCRRVARVVLEVAASREDSHAGWRGTNLPAPVQKVPLLYYTIL
jgi:hypothetical protein